MDELNEWQQQDPEGFKVAMEIFHGNQVGTVPAPPPPQPEVKPRRSEMGQADKIAYIGVHGYDAFMALEA